MVGAIGSAFIGLMLTVLFQDQVSAVVVKLLRGLNVEDGRRNVSGIWHSYYAVSPETGTSPSAADEGILMIRLRQVGKRVTGAGVENSRDYFIIATIQDSYLTGTWRNSINERYSWGAFQLWLLNDGRGMAGKFVGKDSGNHINHGIWLWARTEHELKEVANYAVNSGYAPDIGELTARLDHRLNMSKD